ncbi:MAG: FumA C-terminus/TtdB family hydratase beta subunit [Candidatus Verstraetearchaeota archaeon]|nr:FumA C-terminus/TtdB family hydratase beta subunit [Candidatus Verstraetearchaeota archaeon]
MKIWKLSTILNDEVIEKLNIGDIVYFSGILFTMRDMAHLRAVELLRRGEELPFDLRNKIIYHCGPLLKGLKVVSAGPTTSMRMEELEEELIKFTGLKGIIGKGGMGEKTLNALKKYHCVYMEFPGGAGALAAKRIKSIKEVYWKDLGDPEAVWVLEVEDFGPCFITMDSKGNRLR